MATCAVRMRLGVTATVLVASMATCAVRMRLGVTATVLVASMATGTSYVTPDAANAKAAPAKPSGRCSDQIPSTNANVEPDKVPSRPLPLKSGQVPLVPLMPGNHASSKCSRSIALM